MFENMMGNMEEKQAALQKKLADMTVEVEMGDGGVIVEANCTRQITNISLNKEKLDWEDPEQVEDLLMVAINRVLEKAAAKEALESEKLLKEMLPPGMGDLGSLFG